MTDFFADLERELRAAHPRRARPAVPVKGLAFTAAVAATLVAVVIGLGALAPGAEREVATQPETPGGWTAYAPDCGGRVVDGRIPDELVDRFALLRGDASEVTLPPDRIPSGATEVIRQSLREIGGPDGTRFVFAVVREGGVRCEPGPLTVCLISLTSPDGVCSVPGEDEFVVQLTIERPRGREVFAVLTEDGVRETRVDGTTARVTVKGNTGFLISPGPTDEGITPLPGGESCDIELGQLEQRLPAFERPAENAGSLGVTPPRGLTYLLEHARIFKAHGARYVVFPACGTTVCMWREGTENTVCSDLPTKEQGQLVLAHHTGRGEDMETAGLVAGRARAVRYGDVEARVESGFFSLTHPADVGAQVEVVPAS